MWEMECWNVAGWSGASVADRHIIHAAACFAIGCAAHRSSLARSNSDFVLITPL